MQLPILFNCCVYEKGLNSEKPYICTALSTDILNLLADFITCWILFWALKKWLGVSVSHTYLAFPLNNKCSHPIRHFFRVKWLPDKIAWYSDRPYLQLPKTRPTQFWSTHASEHAILFLFPSFIFSMEKHEMVRIPVSPSSFLLAFICCDFSEVQSFSCKSPVETQI